MRFPRIKTFKFKLETYDGNCLEIWEKVENDKIYTEKEIDAAVNKWILNNEAIVKDIKVNTYTVNRSGDYQEVVAVYTVIYELSND